RLGVGALEIAAVHADIKRPGLRRSGAGRCQDKRGGCRQKRTMHGHAEIPLCWTIWWLVEEGGAVTDNGLAKRVIEKASIGAPVAPSRISSAKTSAPPGAGWQLTSGCPG